MRKQNHMNEKQTEFFKMFQDPIFVSINEKGPGGIYHIADFLNLMKLNRGGSRGAYFSVNGFADYVKNQSRTIDSCTSLNAHFVEIDNPGKSTHEIANEAMALAVEKGIPFTCMVKTGRGVHGYWLLKQPIMKPTGEQKGTYEHIQDQLTEIFAGDRRLGSVFRLSV